MPSIKPGLVRKPLIGLTGRRKKGRAVHGVPGPLGDFDIDMYYANYALAVIEAGGVPVQLSLESDPSDVIGYLDGVLFSGGADISPSRYGRRSETDFDPPEPERDAFEMGLLDEVTRLQKPALGVCRGMQLFNVHGGGTLNQHVPEHLGYFQATTTGHHEIIFESETVIGGLYGQSRNVNSLHHQSVDDLASGFVVAGRTKEGSVEAIEHKSLPMLGVQWHPEMLSTRAIDPLFAWLIGTAEAQIIGAKKSMVPMVRPEDSGFFPSAT